MFTSKPSFLLVLFMFLFPFTGQTQDYLPVPEWYSDYDVKFYKIDIEANDTSINLKGYAEIIAEITASDVKLFNLELLETIIVDSVIINGQKTTFNREDELLQIVPSYRLSKGDNCIVRVYYNVPEVKREGFFTGLSNKKDNAWDISVTWTLSEPFNAKCWFPCKQHLPDKADSAYIFITVPANRKAGAPGVLSNITPVPDGKMRYEWKTCYPVAYYLLSFTVADYQDYTIYAHPKGIDKPVPVQNFIYNREGYLEKNKEKIDATASLIELYSELFLPYPFADEKYGHCAAPMGGGMEHQTMTTLSEFDFLLVAHELAHQWFGDLVTCASFQDIWINEGFASYSEYLALEKIYPEQKLNWIRQTHSYSTWSDDGSVFVPHNQAKDEWRIFDHTLSYKKGATLVHNIRHIVNDDEKFFDILRGFLHKYSFSVATGMDFKQYLEEQTGMDFTWFFDQWYFGEGYPVYDVSWKKTDEELEILIEHTGSSEQTPLFITDLEVRIVRKDDTDTIIQLPIRSNREFFKQKFADDVKYIEIDPNYWELKHLHNSNLVSDFPTNDNFVTCNTHIIRRQELKLNFSEATMRNCKLKLTDTNGKTVFIEKPVKKKKEISIPMENLNYSTYLLHIQNGKNKYVRKILKTAY